jgi:hypothetical protein
MENQQSIDHQVTDPGVNLPVIFKFTAEIFKK